MPSPAPDHRPAGYRATPLRDKLGIREGFRLAAPGAPDRFVCAIDTTWSGLKFVLRQERRTGR